MRLRHKPWALDALKAAHSLVIVDPIDWRGRFKERFANPDRPLHIEVGSGKGRFIVELAKAHPENNYIAIELQASVLVTVLEKAQKENLPNLQLLLANGKTLTEVFMPGEVDRIYLNFSDPWPKKRHAKRRLTSPQFLTVYQTLLNETGDLHFKTDNRGLFEYSLVTMNTCGMLFEAISLDLHQEDTSDNVMTEYEEKFSAKGHPIYRLVARFKSSSSPGLEKGE